MKCLAYGEIEDINLGINKVKSVIIIGVLRIKWMLASFCQNVLLY
jgi:hypothetical protein